MFLQFLSYIIIFLLTSMCVILLINLLIRPVLWTAFNIVMLIYFLLTTILGSLNIFMITSVISQHTQPINEENYSLSSLFAKHFPRWDQLEKDCTIYVFWSGTWIVREGILTGMIFTRKRGYEVYF